MEFCWATIAVKNMEESLKFYQEIVGLPINRRFQAGPGVEIAFLGEGETLVELICHQSPKGVDLGKDISLGFKVNSLDAKIAFIKEQGLALCGDPYVSPNAKFFFVLDPNGLKIQFVEI